MKRIMILGDKGTGKTTFLNIFLNKQLPEHEEPTLGVEAGAKTIEFEDHSFVNLQVWDTPGEEEYSQMAYPFYANYKFKEIEENNLGRHNNVLVILNRVPKKLHSSSNSFEYTKASIEQRYRKQLEMAERNKLHITIKEIDLIDQRQHLNKMYIYPYLHENLGEEIVTQTEEKKPGKFGNLNCQSESCLVM